MACYDTSPYLCTYDSGGAGSLPGGGDPDYSSLSTWESDSDNDLSGLGILKLDCYDSQNHDDAVNITGASGLDATHYRQIQSSSSCATPFAGKIDTGANFRSTVYSLPVIRLYDYYSRIVDLCVKLTRGHSAVGQAIFCEFYRLYLKVLNCVIHDSSVIGGAFNCDGVYTNSSIALIYNCIAYGNTGSGSYTIAWYAGTYTANICCTFIDNGEYGFEPLKSGGVNFAFSCYGADNTSGDFIETNWSSPSGWNASKDTTSDLGGTAGNNYKNSIDLTDTELDADYLPVWGQTLSWSGGAGDNAGRNPYNDVTASYDFNDFFKNDTGGEAISKKDIRGIDRPTPDTADVSWDVGAGEQTASATTTSSTTTTTTTSSTTTSSSSTTISFTTTTITVTTTTQPYQHLVFIVG